MTAPAIESGSIEMRSRWHHGHLDLGWKQTKDFNLCSAAYELTDRAGVEGLVDVEIGDACHG
jgi:hypothetical protein